METKEQLGGFILLEVPTSTRRSSGRRARRGTGTVHVTEIRPVMDYDRYAERAAVLSAVERAYREHFGRAVAALIRSTGDWDVAEEAVQDAFATALERWPRDGVPRDPAGVDRRRRAQPRDRPDPARAHAARARARARRSAASADPTARHPCP